MGPMIAAVWSAAAEVNGEENVRYYFVVFGLGLGIGFLIAPPLGGKF